jgi:nitronate monooxygenase
MMTLQSLFNTQFPIIQAPMAGVQDHRLAVAVSNAGGLGSLPAAMLSLEMLHSELIQICAQTDRPYNVNFFCHTPPQLNQEREAVWHAALAPYYKELGLDIANIAAGPGCRCAGSLQATGDKLSFWPALP